MHRKNAGYIVILKLLLLTGLLCPTDIAYSQSGEKIPIIHLGKNLSSVLNEAVLSLPSSPLPPLAIGNKYLIFLDSLEKKAGKNKLTKKIYDLVVVNADSSGNKVVARNSESAYIEFSGMKIRKIEVKRLNVFGVDINNPDAYHPVKSQNLLNKTHINTSENIIRKNLIFSPGDTISPIVLSDNERILRELSFIDDARITLVPVSKDEVDIIVITKDIYSLGGSYEPSAGISKGTITAFENNIMGLGHELGIEIPYDKYNSDSPGLGFRYYVDNIGKTFINLKLYYINGLGKETYGFDLSRRLVSTSTKYAGGISVRYMDEKVNLDTLTVPQPFRYNFQDYWLSRSFILNNQSVTRLIIGGRITSNNVFDRPYINPDSYHSLQKYMLFLGSAAISVQKYYKANLIYGYGRTEDIPYGGILKVTFGREINEFKDRNYAASEISFGSLLDRFGYIYSSTGLGAFIKNRQTEQGILTFRVKYISNLLPMGRNMIRNFVRMDYTRGFDRDMEEHLKYFDDNGFSGYRNDSVQGTQRMTINLETVVFSHSNLYGFKFAFFGFADFSALSGTNQVLTNGTALSGLGLGIRIRNNNLIFNTFQLRLGFFPNPPLYSRINYFTVSGEQMLRMENFESGPPSMIPYR